MTTFHIEAQNQKRIIEEVLDGENIHKKDGGKINEDELILEPSYFVAYWDCKVVWTLFI